MDYDKIDWEDYESIRHYVREAGYPTEGHFQNTKRLIRDDIKFLVELVETLKDKIRKLEETCDFLENPEKYYAPMKPKKSYKCKIIFEGENPFKLEKKSDENS